MNVVSSPHSPGQCVHSFLHRQTAVSLQWRILAWIALARKMVAMLLMVMIGVVVVDTNHMADWQPLPSVTANALVKKQGYHTSYKPVSLQTVS